MIELNTIDESHTFSVKTLVLSWKVKSKAASSQNIMIVFLLTWLLNE